MSNIKDLRITFNGKVLGFTDDSGWLKAKWYQKLLAWIFPGYKKRFFVFRELVISEKEWGEKVRLVPAKSLEK